MAISADFTINGVANPARHETTYGATVNLALVNPAGIDVISWEIETSSDSGDTLPTITPGGTPTGATASFTMVADPSDGLGRTMMVKCTVSTAYETATSRGVVGVLNDAGRLPVCANEGKVRDAVSGWLDELNTALASSAFTNAPDGATFLPYRIERALRSGKHLDVSAGNNQDAFFATPDGSRLFIVESGGGPPFGVEQWSLSTPGDLDTATLDGTFEHGLGSVTGIAFNSAGTRMYLVDDTDNVIDQFNIEPENAWDVIADDPTHAGSASVSTQTTAPSGITVTPDGTKAIVSSATVLYQYTLSTPDEVIGGSLSFDTSLTLSTRGARWANGFDGTPGGLLIYSTGSVLAARNCPTPYSIAGTVAESLATFSPGIGSIPGSSSSNVVDLHFINDGARMWLLGDNDIFEFHTTAVVPAQ